jgi:hypothetical protein
MSLTLEKAKENARRDRKNREQYLKDARRRLSKRAATKDDLEFALSLLRDGPAKLRHCPKLRLVTFLFLLIFCHRWGGQC